MVQRQLGADLWDTLTGGFTGATTAAKTGASAAWAATKSAASAAYQADAQKQLKCQRNEPLDGLGGYYDPETQTCMPGEPVDQKASCEASGGVWTASEVPGSNPENPATLAWGCISKDAYNAKVAAGQAKPKCRRRFAYDYNFATELCGAKNGPKWKARCAKEKGLPIWSPGTPPHEGFWWCVTPKSEAKAQSGMGATGTSRPKAWILPSDSSALYPPPSVYQGIPANAETEGATDESSGGWWASRTTPEKVAIIGGASVVGLGLLWLAIG
jgi:hypothetical protein